MQVLDVVRPIRRQSQKRIQSKRRKEKEKVKEKVKEIKIDWINGANDRSLINTEPVCDFHFVTSDKFRDPETIPNVTAFSNKFDWRCEW